MLIPQSQSETDIGQGRSGPTFAELRRQLAETNALSDVSRQRLVKLAQRLASVQALGDEYRRVELSQAAREALPEAVA
jgi:hypothetical protein